MMGDVGILRTTIGVESHQRRGDVRELPETLVDTGSEYSRGSLATFSRASVSPSSALSDAERLTGAWFTG